MNLKFALYLCLLPILGMSQRAPENWFNLDAQKDGVAGVSTEQAYELLKNKKSKTIIVAIIDSGVDAEHEDLKDVMWINPGEIAGNGKDDDGNGYIDDVHGWNFIGGADGSNVSHDTYEVTRLYGRDKYKYDNADRSLLNKKQKAEYDKFLGYKKKVESAREKAQTNLDRINESKEMITNSIDALKESIGGNDLSAELMDSLASVGNPLYMIGINIWRQVTSSGMELNTLGDMQDLLSEETKGAEEHYKNQLDYAFNPNFNTRTIVGDNYADASERIYGNNDVEGPEAFHGTHVAGIVGAKRNNNIGMNGVADNVRIMAVRAVPDGDERDKDVANAIRYAVDNGASVINMSFGKGQSWNKAVVDEAVRYAKKNDVLLVHASGNSGQNNDKSDNFPTDKFEKKKLFCKKEASNWIEVGASSWMQGSDRLATFSNYGKEEVDVFAPGVAIYSTIPNNKYRDAQGTSMASPVTAGVAALIRSYFPSLTAEQVKEVIMSSVVPLSGKVNRPGDGVEVSASSLSVSNGLVNAEKAVKAASQMKGKRSSKKKYKSDGYTESEPRA